MNNFTFRYSLYATTENIFCYWHNLPIFSIYLVSLNLTYSFRSVRTLKSSLRTWWFAQFVLTAQLMCMMLMCMRNICKTILSANVCFLLIYFSIWFHQDPDGSFIVIPLKDQNKRVFGLLGVDTLKDGQGRSIFITHEIQFYQVDIIVYFFFSSKQDFIYAKLFWFCNFYG